MYAYRYTCMKGEMHGIHMCMYVNKYTHGIHMYIYISTYR